MQPLAKNFFAMMKLLLLISVSGSIVPISVAPLSLRSLLWDRLIASAICLLRRQGEELKDTALEKIENLLFDVDSGRT